MALIYQNKSMKWPKMSTSRYTPVCAFFCSVLKFMKLKSYEMAQIGNLQNWCPKKLIFTLRFTVHEKGKAFSYAIQLTV